MAGSQSPSVPQAVPRAGASSFLCRTVQLTLTLTLVPYFAWLTATYWYPAWATVPDLADGSVILGHATAQSQVVWVHCNAACRARHNQSLDDDTAIDTRILYRPAQELDAVVCAHGTEGDGCHVAHFSRNTTVLTLTSLRPCTTYAYRVLIGETTDDAATLGPDAPRFTTPSLDDADGCVDVEDAAALRFVWGSCLGISPFSDIRAFRHLETRSARTDLVVLMGDTVYTDIPKLDDYVAYSQIWGDSAFASLFSRIPFYGTYDDHEVVNDWSVSDSHQRFHDAMRFFDEFVGAKNPLPPEWEAGLAAPPEELEAEKQLQLQSQPRLDVDVHAPHAEPRRRYYTFRRGRHAAFFVLDTRQYASPVLRGLDATDANVFSPTRTKLGAVQKAHLLHWLRTSTATFKFLCSSVAWSAKAWKVAQDGWAGYRAERDEIFDFISSHNITGVVLLSADLHWAGAFHLDRWNLREVTVSPIQSFPLPHWISDAPDERTLWSSPMWMHFGEVAVHAPDGEMPYVRVAAYKYMYGEPQRAFDETWTIADLVPTRPHNTNDTSASASG